MKNSIITVKTITLGLKVKKALAARGIKSRIVKTDASKSRSGCQYGIEFDSSHFYDVVSVMREYEIEYGVYNSNDIP